MVGLIGASGAVGQAVADVLRAEGREYVAIGRSAAKLDSLFAGDPLARRRVWDTQDVSALTAALQGCDSAIYLIGVEYWKFGLHPTLMRRAVEAARAAGVRRLLLLGTVYPYGRPQQSKVDETHPREPHTFKGRMRKEQEDLVLAAHAPGSFETVVLRCPDLYGPGMEKSFLTAAFAAAPQGKRSMLVGPIDEAHEFAFIPDCARVAVRLLDEPRAYGTFWNYAGPRTITQRAFADSIYAACGKRPNYFVVNKLMLRLVGLFDPMSRELVEMNYLMSDPVIMDDTRLRSLLGELPKTPYDEGIRLTLASKKPA